MSRACGLTAVLLAFAAPSSDAAAAAAVVHVVDERDAPVSGATVLCWTGAKFADLTGPDGTVQVPDTCTEVRCEQAEQGMPAVQVPVRDAQAICRLQRGAVVVITPGPAEPDGALQVLAIRDDGTVGGSLHLSENPEWRAALSRRVGPMAPGRYVLDVTVTGEPGWSCARELGELTAGETPVVLVYREPVTIRGRVRTSSGRPARGEIVRARSATAPPGGTGDDAWICSTARWSGEPLTQDDGSFTLRVDPGAWPVTIEVGHPRDEEGTTLVVLDAPPAGELTITRRPTPYEKGYAGPATAQ
ncbi:MAG: hypothetical protein MUE47_04370 [Acidobacteria bacterium]|jgi:hypothetical protein|nr:hypothetical protein [Acidobacteriota bacterium]